MDYGTSFHTFFELGVFGESRGPKTAVGSEEAHEITLALASVRLSVGSKTGAAAP